MKRINIIGACAAAIVALATGAHADDTLRSPWDAAVPAQSTATQATCPSPPALFADIATQSYYSDPAHSIVDPARKKAYDDAVQPLHDAGKAIEDMADRYRATGDGSSANCAAAWLDRFAKDGVLTGTMATNQDIYVQGWMIGAFAIVWLKIRNDDQIPADTRKRVADWLAAVASANCRYYDKRAAKGDARNNHRYWAGLTAMAAGIAADSRYLFDWGVEAFHVGASQITPDGTLPLEMARGRRALHYHLFAAAPLVAMAELAGANAVDLYGEDDHALPRLVRRDVEGLDDPAFFEKASGTPQEPLNLHADDIAWAEPFARRQRLPDPALAALLDRLPSRSILYLGGLPPP